MEINTKNFGIIDIVENKIIHFTGGIVGFPELTEFSLIHDEEKGTKNSIQWLQSMQEPAFAMPVVDPLVILPDYNPQIEDELLKPIGELDADNMLVLITITVPADLTKMSVNLKGPIIINTESRKACQVIAEGENYSVKYPVYELLKARKAGE
ncbi:MAG: flagellar assembly protein FliW [Lachnospiraceae bacterium]|nr:flagellar assembly protein FliW [Lachnospiraceae bacterium]